MKLGILLARILPPRLVIGGAALCGRCAARFSPARAIVSDNLRRIDRFRRSEVDRSARPEPALARETSRVFASYGRYWGEFLVAAARPNALARRIVRVEGERFLVEAAEKGPVCLLTAHLGNWDLGARWTATRLPGFLVLAERLEPAVFGVFTRIRREGGLDVLAAEGAGMRLYKHLRKGGHAGMLADRPFGAGSREVRFFGGQRRFPSAGIELAIRAGANLVPGFLLRERGGYGIRIYPPLNGGGDPLESWVRILEREIAQHEDQWCMLYPLHESQSERTLGDTA